MTPIFSVSHLELKHTDTTQPDAQAQGEQIMRNISTLPLGLIAPDGHEAAFFCSLAEGHLAPTMMLQRCCHVVNREVLERLG